MKNKQKVLLLSFVLTLADGLYYPVSRIVGYEFPSSQPDVCRFRAEIADPYDPFRGRYVTLRARRQTVRLPPLLRDTASSGDGSVYAQLEQDKEGFARVVGLSGRPVPGKINLKLANLRDYSLYYDKDEEGYYIYQIYFPFDRFYMNEKLAPEAELAFNRAMRSGGTCVIVANVYADGNYAIADLEIDGLPIRGFLAREREKSRKD